ncbi:endo-1,3-1,4-beta-D-glucanase [Polyplosphaeria fusca]|uniref:Endo-1,3-1,4-beta-D-glucanase n=1 Tax=Polyplosphaeria fusca TaxID=682080 RepID=A0A9P4QRZ9_9PLEO|nr:endo-1,3-1,4-beta-D-glucanase [Polyplosphaeria fusca]
MVSDCCLSGFEWDGTPTGSEGTLASNKAYIVGPESPAAILVIADLFGWTFINERLLCDHYAKEANATIYMPDFFGGEVVDPAILKAGPPFAFDLEAWHKRNWKDVRWPEISACAAALREKHARVGVIGYCYGGWSSFQLGSSAHTPRLVDAISAAHPTWLTKEEIDAIGVPVQICAPEMDPTFTPELKRYANEVIPTKGLPYEYVFFPGVAHGFATRGDPGQEREWAAMLRGKRAQVNWMKEWLHGDGKW